MLQIATPQQNIMTFATHQTAILHVAADRSIISISEDAVHLLAASTDVFQIDPSGVLTLPDSPEFHAALASACGHDGQSHQMTLHSQAAARTLTLHILPRPEVGATLVVFANNLQEVPAPQILTPREWDVLFLAAKGLRRDRMAHALGISVATVDLHCANLRKKMGARTTAEAVAKALAQKELVAVETLPR